MTTLPLRPEPLTREAFAPFGDVIEASDAVRHFTINCGNTERYHDLAHIDPGEGGRVIVSIFRGQPRSLPFRVGMMERHPLGSQAFVPMSGRPCLVFDGAFPRERVGDLPTELVPHFFRSLCDTLGANLHLAVRGDNAHHMVEACFKAVARALRTALRRDGSDLPSTKGAL